MKKLIVARHGYFSPCGKLDDFGIDQMTKMAEKLRPYLIGCTSLILSSTAPRALHSANILSFELNINFERHEVLWSDSEHEEDFPKALDLVRSKKNHDVVILVTHLEYGEGFPAYFANKELGGHEVCCEGIRKGQAWVLDCETFGLELL